MTKMQPIPDTAIDQYGNGVFFLCIVCSDRDFSDESSDPATDEDIEAEELWCVGVVTIVTRGQLKSALAWIVEYV